MAWGIAAWAFAACAFASWAQDPPPPKSLKDQITDLAAALKVATPNPDWTGVAEDLRAQLALLTVADAPAAAAKRADELRPLLVESQNSTSKKLLDAVAALLAAAGTIEDNDPMPAFVRRVNGLETISAAPFPFTNAEVLKQITSLRAIVGKLEAGNPVEAFVSHGDKLLALGNTVADEAEVLSKTPALITSLEVVEQVRPSTAIVRRATSLTTYIDTVINQPTDGSGAALLAKENVNAALVKLGIALSKATAPRIHIISATFGDLTAGSTRICNATAALFKECERTRTCSLKATVSSIACGGYDPAPMLDPAKKGIAVRYQCVRGGDDVWSSIEGVDEAKALNVAERTVTIRSHEQSIVCLADVR